MVVHEESLEVHVRVRVDVVSRARAVVGSLRDGRVVALRSVGTQLLVHLGLELAHQVGLRVGSRTLVDSCIGLWLGQFVHQLVLKHALEVLLLQVTIVGGSCSWLSACTKQTQDVASLVRPIVVLEEQGLHESVV